MEDSFLLITALLLFFASFSCMATDRNARKPSVGGQCEYKEYSGQAIITSIRKKELTGSDSRTIAERYEIMFCFQTDEIIEEKHGQVAGREFLLLLENSSYPGPKFLQKYRVEVGKSFDCYLKVITKGTCSPILFDFPTIDLSDCPKKQNQKNFNN